MIAKDKKQLTLIYSNDSSIGKQTLGYIESIKGEFLTIDINKTKVSDTHWVEIQEGLSKPMAEILDTSKIQVRANDFSVHDWITILQKTPECLQKPIAINGDRIQQIETPTEILQFFGVDSAGLEK